MQAFPVKYSDLPPSHQSTKRLGCLSSPELDPSTEDHRQRSPEKSTETPAGPGANMQVMDQACLEDG